MSISELLNLSEPIDISIPLRFDGPQPNAYGVEPATAQACAYGTLIGDTRRGGSCNFERITFIPHCNGTHTESVGHITHERISIRSCLTDVIVPAALVSVEPERVGEDRVITEAVLSEQLEKFGFEGNEAALVIRTLPNGIEKLSAVYDGDPMPPYFAAEAMKLIVESGFKHLLADLPSIDRLFDDGKLANHRIFWNVEPGEYATNESTRVGSTITELIYVPHFVEDGEYLLNLQIAPFESDAAPSRPILIRRNHLR